MLDHQEVWTVAPARRVELFHSPRLGKLLVLCDAKPVVAEKGVFSDGDFDFLIDDALFQISIRRRGLEFFYSLRRDRAAPTAENLARKKAQKAAIFWPLAIFLAALGAAIFLLRR